jgi:hypothetical protein
MLIDLLVDEVRSRFLDKLISFFVFHLASDALKRNLSPIIIDNTNTQTWEMKPYVAMVIIQSLVFMLSLFFLVLLG